MNINNNDNNLESIDVRKKYKKFKDYYMNEEFRRKHLEYLTTPLKCECGAIVQRGYLNTHRKKRKHLNAIAHKNIFDLKDKIDYNKILLHLDKLDKCVKDIQKKIVTIRNNIKNISLNDDNDENDDENNDSSNKIIKNLEEINKSDDYDDIEYIGIYK
ncbi:MAG: hypothetical protein QW303_07425 [Nitrososphaerota archaeon]